MVAASPVIQSPRVEHSLILVWYIVSQLILLKFKVDNQTVGDTFYAGNTTVYKLEVFFLLIYFYFFMMQCYLI